MAEPRKLKIKLIRSVIGCSKKQCLIVKALGLRRTNQVVEQYETPIIQGMIQKVAHLLTVEAA